MTIGVKRKTTRNHRVFMSDVVIDRTNPTNVLKEVTAVIQPVAASKVSKNPGGRSATWLQWIVIRSLKEVVG